MTALFLEDEPAALTGRELKEELFSFGPVVLIYSVPVLSGNLLSKKDNAFFNYNWVNRGAVG